MKFLQLTTISDFVPNNEEVEYLGEWCKNDFNDNTKTFKHVFNTNTKLIDASNLSIKIYKEILPILKEILNDFHNLNKSEKYWEIIFGNWLLTFIQVIYERYTNISEYIKANNEFVTITLSKESFVAPTNYSDFTNKVLADKYNYQLYSEILYFLGFSFSTAELKKDKKQIFSNKKNVPKSLILNFINIFSKNKDNTLSSPYFSNKKNLFKFIGKIYLNDFDENFEFKFKKNLETRNMLFKHSTDNEFINLLFYLFKENFPILYLEGFKDFRHFVLSKDYHVSKVFATANALHNNEIYKFFIAENREKIKLISIQHGGNYGIDTTNSVEFFERNVSDKYLTWGWKENKKTIFSSHEKLNEKIKPKKNGNILYLAKDPLKYLIRFQTNYNSSANRLQYLPKQLSFLSNITNIDNFLYRGYMQNKNSFDITNKVKNKFPNLKIDDHSKNFHSRLREAKLFITDHVHTTYLETLAMNFPTVIFITKEVHSFREPEYFKLLTDAKILFYNEIECAKHVNEISESPEVWWNSDEVQDARKKFVHQYARTSENWVEEWIREFDNILNSEK
ncbi:hypothetical protein ThvES_00012010 [Thiovulum sp. ES]|nr:hypothetical protein ThvES_00012010 [Thiovulum sp. ES]